MPPWESWEEHTTPFAEERGGVLGPSMHLIQGIGGSCHSVTDRPVVLVGRCPEELVLCVSGHVIL